MKIKHLTFGILLSLASCAVFKKTNKSISSQSSVKQMEMSELLLKKANKETQIFTYWNDSGFYQIQHIKEQIDETKSGQLKTREDQENKEKLVKKERKTIQVWHWVLGLGIVIAGYLYFRK